jgi:hypothetical protein
MPVWEYSIQTDLNRIYGAEWILLRITGLLDFVHRPVF